MSLISAVNQCFAVNPTMVSVLVSPLAIFVERLFDLALIITLGSALSLVVKVTRASWHLSQFCGLR